MLSYKSKMKHEIHTTKSDTERITTEKERIRRLTKTIRKINKDRNKFFNIDSKEELTKSLLNINCHLDDVPIIIRMLLPPDELSQ
jgi:hypothetical protein